MSSFLQKATPFFEHIVLGFAFAAIGYVFFWTFNTSASFLGILGMLAVCFGGLKILVGIIIYGGWLFALIFRPEYLKRKEQEEAEAAAKKELEEEEPEVVEDKPWFVKNVRFVVKHWGIILEVSALLIGLLTIVITRGVE
jgi:hypothetical protein